MSFKLPDRPSSKPKIHELADYAELRAWLDGSVSSRGLQNFLSRLDDNDYNVGVEDADDQIEELTDSMIIEIGDRAQACGSGGYPFILAQHETVVKFQPSGDSFIIYLYLLLATRLNMRDDAIHAGHDGTQLFEQLSAQALRSYLGPARAQAFVFGTAELGGFKDKVNDLCKRVGEGGRFLQKHSGDTFANDDKIDVVAWLPFSDGLASKLTVFGQSKTGTSWESSRADLRPENFIKNWMSEPFVLDPIRAFFLADSADRSQWERNATDMGLLFDRCRVVDCSYQLEDTLLSDITNWTNSAKAYLATKWA